MESLPDLAPGDRVALQVTGSRRQVDLVIALLSRGVFPVPLDPRLTPSETTRILAPITPRVVLDSQAAVDAWWEQTTPDERRGLPLGRPMHVTSGTTGTPKGVFSGLLPRTGATALLREEQELWGFRADDVHLVLSPLHHSAPLRFAMGTLLAGGRIVGFDDEGIHPGFDPAEVTATIEAERPTTLFCVPTHLQRLVAHWESHGTPDLGCFRLVAHAGAPCPPALKRQVIDLFPAGSTWEFYGSTEGQFTACRGEEWLRRPGTVGRARAGRSLAVDAEGQIWCAVPEHARFSYYGAPDKTAAAWRDTPDGPAFTVGDLGRLEDGWLHLDGRREDLVITGGVNVYPVEVEEVLGAVPGVEDVAVFGIADDHWGQRVTAAVVGSATEHDLRAHAQQHLSPAKRPKDYRFLDTLPRTLTGKVLRRDLADRV